MNHNAVLLVMPYHPSHLIQPLNLFILGLLKTNLARKTNFFLQTRLFGLLKHEWV